jgi:hypothetical protein
MLRLVQAQHATVSSEVMNSQQQQLRLQSWLVVATLS